MQYYRGAIPHFISLIDNKIAVIPAEAVTSSLSVQYGPARDGLHAGQADSIPARDLSATPRCGIASGPWIARIDLDQVVVPKRGPRELSIVMPRLRLQGYCMNCAAARNYSMTGQYDPCRPSCAPRRRRHPGGVSERSPARATLARRLCTISSASRTSTACSCEG